jgi:hypothetical protein
MPSAKPAADKAPPRAGLGLEEMLGTNWLNKIGIGILVLGLAFFLAYQLQNLGPAGKVLLGVALSAVMIALGIHYEGNERYRLLARASAAGGWSLLFFLSYAVYHVPAAHLVDSRELDFLLMFVVAAAIVGYSLRHRSQATTTLALVLSYLTVGIHRTVEFYSLGASAVLALAVVVLALRMQWFGLELLAILATYFNHFLWVSPVIEAMGPNRVEFPEFHTSIALLAFYWLLFRCSYIYRKPADDNQERLSTAAALLNGFCLLGLLRYQSVHREWAFWALIVLGIVELVLSALAARRRRVAFVVLATLGSALLIAAIPFRYSGSDLSILWLAAAEAFLFAGVFTREIVFRRISMATTLLVVAQMVVLTGAPLLELRLSSVPQSPVYTTALLFVVGALLCYLNAHWVRTRWPELFKHEFDFTVLAWMTFLGGLLALLATWFAFPGMWTALTWALLALLLNVTGWRFSQVSLTVQGNVIAVAAIARLITLNFFGNEVWHGVSLRLITVSGTALLLYAAAPFAAAEGENEDSPWSLLAMGYTWVASILLGVLIWYEISALSVAVAWMMFGLVLLEVSLQLRARFLCWQAFAALVASFVRIFFVNLEASGTTGYLSPRLTTVLPLAIAYFFADWRLRRAQASDPKAKRNEAETVFTYLGTATLAALMYCELKDSWVATGWAGLTLALIASAYVLKRRDFLYQSFLMAFAVAFRVIAYNLLQSEFASLPFWKSPKYYAGTAIALLFAALPIAFALRRPASRPNDVSWMPDSRPEQVFFFVPFGLLTALIAHESTRGQLTITWGIEGLVVFLFAVMVAERSFRLAGLALLLVCVAKIFFLDVWGLDPQSRYITLIVLGGALVLVSFLYSRHKEKFREYL